MGKRRLRELEQRNALLEQRVQHNRELAEAWRHADAAALELQKSENARHFEALNHENARVSSVTERSVSREKFDAFADGINRQLRNMLVRMAAVSGGAVVAWYFLQKIFIR